MDELRLRPRWVGPASVVFSVALAAAVFGGAGYGLVSLLGSGPSAEEEYFSRTLPRWWIALSKGETPEVDALAEAPDDHLRAPLARIADLLRDDPRGVAVEAVALNQAIEQAGLPFFVDVVVRGRWPVVLTFRVVERDRWQVGDTLQDVVIADRLDRTNVVTAFTGRKGEDLPVVLLEPIEGAVLRMLRERPEGPVEALVRTRTVEAAEAAVPGFDGEAAAEAVRAREKAIRRLEQRWKLRITRPGRFAIREAWYEGLAELGDGHRLFEAGLDRVREADRALREPPLADGLRFIRDLRADIGSAHQVHVALAPDLADAEPPEALRFVYGDEATSFRTGGHIHMRAALGAIRDAASPACFALLRTLQGGAGPNRRATAWYYGTVSALLELFDTRELDPHTLAERAERACEGGDDALRARAAAVLERLGVARAVRGEGPNRPRP